MCLSCKAALGGKPPEAALQAPSLASLRHAAPRGDGSRRLHKVRRGGLLARFMQLFLARHGNTFGPTDRVVWIGREQDLPLVEAGRRQAEALAEAFARAHVAPSLVLCGPLTRTREFADIVTGALGLPTARIEPRLDEIDYGAWSGLTRDEIVARFGADEVDAWVEHARWPDKAGFGNDEATLRDEARSLVADLQHELGDEVDDTAVLLVSSNGRLRYFLELIDGEFERRRATKAFAVGTGRLGRIDVARDERAVDAPPTAVLRYWNVEPRTSSHL